MATAAVLADTRAISKGVYQTNWNWSTTATGFGNPLNAPALAEKTVQMWFPTGAGFTSNIDLLGSNATAYPATGVGATELFTLTGPTGGLIGTTSGGGDVRNSGTLIVISENSNGS